MGREIKDEFSDIPSKSVRWAKRHPEKLKEYRRKYEQSDKGRARLEKYREKKRGTATQKTNA